MNLNVDPIAPHRNRLLGLAYRMLGSRADAEDVLQDAWLRFRGAADVTNVEAFLVTTVTRLCLDWLKSARAHREVYIGTWLPEPVLDGEALSPHATTELADDLSFALMLLIDRLSPAERAAFLLHDIFDLNYAEVAQVLGKSEPASRQLAARARKAVRNAKFHRRPPDEVYHRLFRAFGEAIQNGDVARLAAHFHEDAVYLSDAGGKRLTALRPVVGADRIARLLVGGMRKFGAPQGEIRTEIRPVNGTPGILVFIDGLLSQITSIAVEDEKILAFYVQLNPEKLRRIEAEATRAAGPH